MSSLKERLHKLVMQDQLEEVIDFLLDFTRKKGLNDLYESVVIQASQSKDLVNASKQGTLSFDESSRARNKIRVEIMQVIREVDHINDTPGLQTSLSPSAKKKGISEQRLKKHVLLLIFLLKIIVILFLFHQWETGGFSTDQFIGVLSLLIPLFTTYTALMIRDFIQNRHVVLHGALKVSRSFQFTTYLFLLAYGLGLFVILDLKPRGIISFQQMSILLTLLEAGLGIYIGKIVFAMFNEEEN